MTRIVQESARDRPPTKSLNKGAATVSMLVWILNLGGIFLAVTERSRVVTSRYTGRHVGERTFLDRTVDIVSR